MNVVKLGKSGQVSIPREALRRLGLEPGSMLLVDVTPEGEIRMRPAGVYPIEIYSEERIAEFLAEDEPSAGELKQRRRR